MPKTKISEFDSTAANNTDIDGINLAEGMLPSDVNNAIRELMAQLKDFQTGAGGDSFNGPIGSTTAVSGAFTTVSATGDVSIADKIVHTGDTNTAIRFPSADTVTVETDGTERLRVTSTGAVQLSNNLTFTGTGNRITGDFSNATVANRVAFQTSTTNASTVIGAIPNGTAVTSVFRTFNNSDLTNAGQATFGINSSNAFFDVAALGSGTQVPMVFGVAGSERLRIDTSGNVGIGTSSPAVRLDVSTTSDTIATFTSGNKALDGTGNVRIFTSTTQAANIGGSISLGGLNGSAGSFDPWAFGIIKGAKENSTAGNFSGYLAFGTSSSGGAISERMRIDSAGNVGIGLTSPTVALDVLGTIEAQVALTQDAVRLAGRAGGTSSFSVTLTPATLSANRTLTLPDENATLGYLNIPQNSQSAAYTLVAADAGKHILHPSADTTARTFTIPANSSVPYAVGTAITFINQNGAGVVTIAITSDTMRLAGAGTTGSRTLAANGVATAIKITSTEWIISGTGLT